MPGSHCSAVLNLVAAATGVALDDLCSRKRDRHIARARQLAAWSLRRWFPELSLAAIGRELGGLDHATVKYAITQVEARATQHDAYCQVVQAVAPAQLPDVLVGTGMDAHAREVGYVLALYAAECIAGRPASGLRATLIGYGLSGLLCDHTVRRIHYAIAAVVQQHTTD